MDISSVEKQRFKRAPLHSPLKGYLVTLGHAVVFVKKRERRLLLCNVPFFIT